jgi:xanthine dehydrogenase small subunit
LRAIPGDRAYSSFNSCIMTVAQLDGSSLISVEALSQEGELSPVQKSMMVCHGSQCGFCTPGFVVALAGAVDTKLAGSRAQKPTAEGSTGRLTEREAKNALTGNLCRCTGYQPIIDAATDIDLLQCQSLSSRFSSREQLRELKKVRAQSVLVKNEAFEFFAPLSLREAARFLSKNRDARILAAATDLGVFHNKRRARLVKCVSLHLVEDLDRLAVLKNGRIRVGARVTLTALREFCKKREPELARFLDIFASPQIKNVATLVGNVANASPIADTPPFLLVADAEVHIVGTRGGERSLALADFFIGYRKTALKPGEVIAAISFRPSAKTETTALYKVSERKDLDISNVNAGFRATFSLSKTGRIASSVRIAYGGVSAVPLRLRKTEKMLEGKLLTAELLREAARSMQSEVAPIDDVRGSGTYRRVLAENLFARFFGGDS